MNNKPFFKANISFALIMLIIGPFMGLLHQENSTRINAYQFHKNEIYKVAPEQTKKLLQVLNTISPEFSTKPAHKIINAFITDESLRQKFCEATKEIHNKSTFSRKSAYDFIRLQLGLDKALDINDAELTVYLHNLARVHGHAILIGSLIPLAMCFILFMTQKLEGGEITNRSLKFVSVTYITSASLTLLLMTLKGLMIQSALKLGVTDISQLEDSFLPNHIARAVVYGVTHTATFVGLYYFVYLASKSLNMTTDITEQDLLKKKNLMLRINGVIWVGVGVMLITRGIPLFPETSSSTFFIALSLGIIIGTAKGIFVLSKTGKKNALRIEALQKPVLITQAISIKLVLLIPFMILLGILLRKYVDSIPGTGYTVGAIYIGIGTALIFSSRHYWFTNLKKKQ